MDYRDFVEQVKEQIRDYLPEKFRNAEISVHEVIKNNDCRLDGLSIRTEESNVTPTIYLNPYYAKLQDGAEMEDILTAIADIYQEHYVDQKMDIDKIMDYDNVKDRIICKLINEEANRDYLKNKPYTKMEDLAVVYQILMNKRDYEQASITVTDNLLEAFGVSLEDIHEQAIRNMDILQPYSFRGISETVIDLMAQNIACEEGISIEDARDMAASMMPETKEMMYVLTNDTKVDGAAAILNDDIRQEIADKIGDFYVLPSSVHEVLIVPKDAGCDRKELEQMVKEVNNTEVAAHEVLSDHVYEYDAKEHELLRSDKVQERTNAREHREEKGERHSLKDRLAEKKDKVVKVDFGDEDPTAVKKKQAIL